MQSTMYLYKNTINEIETAVIQIIEIPSSFHKRSGIPFNICYTENFIPSFEILSTILLTYVVLRIIQTMIM